MDDYFTVPIKKNYNVTALKKIIVKKVENDSFKIRIRNMCIILPMVDNSVWLQRTMTSGSHFSWRDETFKVDAVLKNTTATNIDFLDLCKGTSPEEE